MTRLLFLVLFVSNALYAVAPSLPAIKIPGSDIYQNRGIVYFFRNTSSLLPT